MLDIYKNIKRLRKLNGWTQEELATRMGYTDRSMIAKIENGKVNLGQTKILEFAKVLGVNASELMGNDGIIYPEDTPEAKAIRDGYKRGFPVNGTEMLIIEHYRIADPDIQKAILKLLDLEYAFGGGYESSLGLSKVANDR